jgi:hypothetical protein
MKSNYIYYERIKDGEASGNVKSLYSFEIMVKGSSQGYVRNWLDEDGFTWVDFGSHSEFFRYKQLDTVEIEIRDEEDHFLFRDEMPLELFYKNFAADRYLIGDSAYSINWKEMPNLYEGRNVYYRFVVKPNPKKDVPRKNQTVETRLVTILYLLGEHPVGAATGMIQEMIADYQTKKGVTIGYQVIDDGLEIYDGDIDSE